MRKSVQRLGWVCERMCIPIAYNFIRLKGSIISGLSYCDGRFTSGDGNYRGQRFEMRKEVGREGEEGGDGRRGRVCGVGVVLVEVACGLL